MPEEFEVVGYIEIEHPHRWERRFHRYLESYRSNSRREFFACSFEVIAPLFLRNEDACARWDGDFTPGLYPTLIESLPNPYQDDTWLE